MQPEFWLQHWQRGLTGFHRDAPHPALLTHWPTLGLAPGSRVLVPLAGKSLDMLWLAAQGQRVLGVELSPVAVQQFLQENDLQAEVHESTQGTHYVSDHIEIIQGDVFALHDDILASCDAIYDRAAIIALPAAMRSRYVDEIYARLPARCRGLLIALDYAQAEMEGPPFALDASDVNTLLGNDWHIQQLARTDVLATNPGLQDRGLTSLYSCAYRLSRRQ